MRVISGKYKGMKLDGFNISGTRPTMDRVKESIFSIIQDYIKNSIVLDLFAGSGSLGIEALSNYSKYCYFVDNNNEVIKVIEKNTLKIENLSILKYDYKEALKYFKENNIKFDLIFLDPPYNLNLINSCIALISEYHLLNDNGIIVCEFENEVIKRDDYKLFKEKKYGTKNVNIYVNEIV